MSLANLMDSDSVETRLRSYNLFYSILYTNPMEIINNFSNYYTIILSLMNKKPIDSVPFCSLTEMLYKTIIHGYDQVEERSVEPILEFILAILEFPKKNRNMDAFILHLFFSQQYYEVIQKLFCKFDVQKFLTILFRILPYDDNHVVLNLVRSHVGKLVSLFVSKKEEYFPFILRSYQSQDGQLSDYALHILLSAFDQDISLFEYVIPYEAYFKARCTQNDFQSFKNFKAKFLVSYTSPVVHHPIDQPCIPQISLIRKENKLFSLVDSNTSFKYQNNKKKLKEQIDTALQSNNQDGLLEMSASAKQSSTKSEVVPQTKHVPVTVESPKTEPLRTFALKLGGFKHQNWQKRYFEYYPINKCLVWRKENQPGGVKGILLLDDTVKIELEQDTPKSKPFRVILVPQNGKKQHEIAFDRSDIAETWYCAMKTAI